jgi:hypothetical protein
MPVTLLRFLLGIVLPLSFLFISGCAPVDPCASTVCYNDGVCIDGTCYCKEGFSGFNCLTESGYDCNNGNCIAVTGSPQFPSLAICETSGCQPATNPGYNCISGQCRYSNTDGQYASLFLCQSNCSSSSAGYVCANGNCSFVQNNATYTTLSACQNVCNAPPQEGQLMIWTSNSSPCPAGAGRTISVYIDGNYAGGLDGYYTSAPSCGASNAVTKTLPPGNYNVRAQCGSTTWGPIDMTVTVGGCTKLQLT